MDSRFLRSTVDTKLLHPKFVTALEEVLGACLARHGKLYVVNEGFRSWARSHQLRMAYLAGGPRAAPAGFSLHNYGLAVDLILDGSDAPGLQPAWTAKEYDVLRDEALAAGHHSGASYGDSGHVSFRGLENHSEVTQRLRALWRQDQSLDVEARLRNAWNYVDSLG